MSNKNGNASLDFQAVKCLKGSSSIRRILKKAAHKKARKETIEN